MTTETRCGARAEVSVSTRHTLSVAHTPSAGSAPRTAAASVAGQLAVGDAVGTGGLDAEALDLVLLVRGEVALEPVPLRRVLLVTLVREDVRHHPVEEPPVVADHHGAARELEQGVLQGPERLDV